MTGGRGRGCVPDLLSTAVVALRRRIDVPADVRDPDVEKHFLGHSSGDRNPSGRGYPFLLPENGSGEFSL